MIVEESIIINANTTQIWNVLTNPNIFNDCFKVISINYNDLKVGETISFISSNQTDKAIIHQIIPDKVLAYDYYKVNAQHSIHIHFKIIQFKSYALLCIKGSDFINKEEHLHSKQAWKSMLTTFKKYIEYKKS